MKQLEPTWAPPVFVYSDADGVDAEQAPRTRAGIHLAACYDSGPNQSVRIWWTIQIGKVRKYVCIQYIQWDAASLNYNRIFSMEDAEWKREKQ